MATKTTKKVVKKAVKIRKHSFRACRKLEVGNAVTVSRRAGVSQRKFKTAAKAAVARYAKEGINLEVEVLKTGVAKLHRVPDVVEVQKLVPSKPADDPVRGLFTDIVSGLKDAQQQDEAKAVYVQTALMLSTHENTSGVQDQMIVARANAITDGFIQRFHK